MKREQISLSEAFTLSEKQVNSYFRRHVNPGLLSIYRILGIDRMDIVKARGCDLILRSGEHVLDLTSGLGVLALGHNHPAIVETQNYCNEHEVLDILKLGVHRLQAVLAHNIASCVPDPLAVCYFSVSGAEANESALKLMTRVQPTYKKYFICTEGGYHGKTHGSLSI